MRILVIEDDENKRDKIVAFLKERYAGSEISTARSYQSGLRAVVSSCPDWLVLDMAMPTFDTTDEDDGGRPQAFAGREILRQMKRRNIVIPTIVITWFDRFGDDDDTLTLSELDSELKRVHPGTYRGSVYFDLSYDGWKEELASYMLKPGETDSNEGSSL